MCTVKRAKKERELLQRVRREESRSQEGSLEKRARIAPWKLQRRLRSVSDQKSPRFSRVNKLLFQIRTKYSQGIFISRKYICITTKERARETCPKYWNSCVDTSGHLVWCDKHKMLPHGPAASPPPPSFPTRSSRKFNPREAERQGSGNRGIEKKHKNATGNWQNISTCT